MHWVRAATAWAPRVSTDPYHVIHTKVQKVIHCSLTLETPEAVVITGKWMTFFQKLSECSFFLPPSSYQAEISFFKKGIWVRSWEPVEISIAGPLPKETPNPDRSPAKTDLAGNFLCEMTAFTYNEVQSPSSSELLVTPRKPRETVPGDYLWTHS